MAVTSAQVSALSSQIRSLMSTFKAQRATGLGVGTASDRTTFTTLQATLAAYIAEGGSDAMDIAFATQAERLERVADILDVQPVYDGDDVSEAGSLDFNTIQGNPLI